MWPGNVVLTIVIVGVLTDCEIGLPPERLTCRVNPSCAAGAPGADTPGAFSELNASLGVQVVGVPMEYLCAVTVTSSSC
jgi:hypothetical protein